MYVLIKDVLGMCMYVCMQDMEAKLGIFQYNTNK